MLVSALTTTQRPHRLHRSSLPLSLTSLLRGRRTCPPPWMPPALRSGPLQGCSASSAAAAVFHHSVRAMSMSMSMSTDIDTDARLTPPTEFLIVQLRATNVTASASASELSTSASDDSKLPGMQDGSLAYVGKPSREIHSWQQHQINLEQRAPHVYGTTNRSDTYTSDRGQDRSGRSVRSIASRSLSASTQIALTARS